MVLYQWYITNKIAFWIDADKPCDEICFKYFTTFIAKVHNSMRHCTRNADDINIISEATIIFRKIIAEHDYILKVNIPNGIGLSTARLLNYRRHK